MHDVPKWSGTLKILQQILQDFQSLYDLFVTLCIQVKSLWISFTYLYSHHFTVNQFQVENDKSEMQVKK